MLTPENVEQAKYSIYKSGRTYLKRENILENFRAQNFSEKKGFLKRDFVK